MEGNCIPIESRRWEPRTEPNILAGRAGILGRKKLYPVEFLFSFCPQWTRTIYSGEAGNVFPGQKNFFPTQVNVIALP